MKAELPYSLEIQPARNFVKVSITGFWDPDSIEHFSREIESAIRAVRLVSHGPILLLSDGSVGPIQHRDTIVEMQKLAERFRSDIKRLAFLVERGALHKMQVQRVDSSTNRRVFDDRDAAMAWLFEDEHPADGPTAGP